MSDEEQPADSFAQPQAANKLITTGAQQVGRPQSKKRSLEDHLGIHDGKCDHLI